MIIPTVGRVVWYFPDPTNGQVVKYGEQPMAATVAFVYNERTINIGFLHHQGKPGYQQAVPLLQDDDPIPDEGHYCTWMPYQKAQAEKAEQREIAVTVGGEVIQSAPSTGTDRPGYAPRENAQGE